MNFGNPESRWQAFEGVRNGHLPEQSLMGSGLDYNLHTVSHSPRTAAEYELESYDTLVQDCVLTPVSTDGDLDPPYSDSTSLPWPTSFSQDFDLPSISPEYNTQDVAKGMRKERRRAQNRKAQKAFRERKDKAIQRLEEEVDKLNTLNQSLSTANEARLREISELRAELEERRSSLSSSPARNSYFEGWDGMNSKRGSVSSDKTSTSAATTPVMLAEPADVCGPFIKWRGKMKVGPVNDMVQARDSELMRQLGGFDDLWCASASDFRATDFSSLLRHMVKIDLIFERYVKNHDP